MVSGAAALVSLPIGLRVNVYANGPLDFTLDIDGYFAPDVARTAVGLIPLANTRRFLETRPSPGYYSAQGALAAGVERSWKLTDVTYEGVTIPGEAVVLLATVTALP